MKSAKSVVATIGLILFVSLSALAGPGSKVTAVVNRADWCSVCKANGERAMAALMDHNREGNVSFVMNDLTNDQTKSESTEQLKKVGLDKAMSEYNGTGMVYFFNAETKELITKISVSKSDEELAQAITIASEG